MARPYREANQPRNGAGRPARPWARKSRPGPDNADQKGVPQPRDNGKPGRFINGTPCDRCNLGKGEHYHEGLLLCTKHYAEVIGERGYRKWKERTVLIQQTREKMGLTSKGVRGMNRHRFRYLLHLAGYKGPPRQKWGAQTGKSHGEGVHYGDEKRNIGSTRNCTGEGMLANGRRNLEKEVSRET